MRKPGLAIAIMKGKPDGMRKEEEREEAYGAEALEDAGKEVFAALKDNDESAFTDALRSFVNICVESEYEED